MHGNMLGSGIPASTTTTMSSKDSESWAVKRVCPHMCIHVHITQHQPSATETWVHTAQPAQGQPWWCMNCCTVHAKCKPLVPAPAPNCSQAVGCDLCFHGWSCPTQAFPIFVCPCPALVQCPGALGLPLGCHMCG